MIDKYGFDELNMIGFVSIIDKEAVLEVAQALQIDGIMSFACDPGVITAAYIAERMRLPFQGSYEANCIL